jgi:hypothetical protein
MNPVLVLLVEHMVLSEIDRCPEVEAVLMEEAVAEPVVMNPRQVILLEDKVEAEQ